MSDSNVVSFPESWERQWQVFEKSLKSAMLETGSNGDEIEYALKQVKPFYIRSAKGYNFSGNPAKVIEELNGWVKQTQSDLLLGLVYKEVEIYRLRGDKSTL